MDYTLMLKNFKKKFSRSQNTQTILDKDENKIIKDSIIYNQLG